MPKIQLNPLITDIRNKMGNNVFSKWKGINYVREYRKCKDPNTEAQQEIRNVFSTLVTSWKCFDTVIRESWKKYASGKDMSGYNAFIGRNFSRMKSDLELLISMPMGEEPLSAFKAVPGQNPGEIECTFNSILNMDKKVIIFTQKVEEGDSGEPLRRFQDFPAQSPLTISGLEENKDYYIYAVVTDGQSSEAQMVSSSVSTQSKAAKDLTTD